MFRTNQFFLSVSVPLSVTLNSALKYPIQYRIRRLTTSFVAMTTSQTGLKSHIATCRCWGLDCARTLPSHLQPRSSATGNAVWASHLRGTPTSEKRLLTSASFRSKTCARSCTPSTRKNIITSTRKYSLLRLIVHRLLSWINSSFLPYSR